MNTARRGVAPARASSRRGKPISIASGLSSSASMSPHAPLTAPTSRRPRAVAVSDPRRAAAYAPPAYAAPAVPARTAP